MLNAATLGDDGLYNDPLFHDTFLDLGEDNAEATAQGKILMVLVEQNGCPYCREMHEVNFQRPEIRKIMEAKFFPIQLDLFGAREVTDFEGNAVEERDFIAGQNIQFTPTAVFYNSDGTEIFRLPGYFKPFHHLSALEYVSSGAYLEQNFQRFLQAKFAELAEQGIDPEVW